MDYRRSTYEPPSLVPAPSQEEKIDGTPETDPTVNNRIRITVNSGNEQVRSIRVIARSSEDPATWFVIEDIYIFDDRGFRLYDSNANLFSYFYNDRAREVVDAVEVYNLFTYVPIKAKHMELIEGNRLVFGNITEGYKRIASQVSVDLGCERLSGITTQKTYFSVNVTTRDKPFNPGIKECQVEWNLPANDPVAGTIWMRFKDDDGTAIWKETSAVWGTGTYPTDLRTALINAFNIEWPGEIDTCWSASTFKFCSHLREWIDGSEAPAYYAFHWEFYIIKSVISEVYKYPALKTGVTQSWGIVYRDTVGRMSPIVGAGEITKYIDFPTENVNSNVGRRPQISFNISHVPPSWAKSYEIVYAGNKSISWHLHLMGYNFSFGKTDHDDPTSTLLTETYRLRINKMQSLTRNYLHNWSVEEYVWQKGDRIRIIGKVSSGGVLTEINGAIYDVEITGVYSDTDPANNIGDTQTAGDTTDSINEWIYFPVNSNIVFVPGTGSTPLYYPDNVFVEIYRPFSVETGLFFTTGMTFPIATDVYGNKYHKADVDQVLDSSGS